MSRRVNLEIAAREISMAVTPNNTKNPFYFIVGAGISSPVIPTANKIIDHCKEQVQISPLESQIEDKAGEYSEWLQRAYPHPKSRREYFRSLIENKTITSANFKLAHLLSEGNLGKVVITPNFDNFLARALTLFNSSHMICDHPGTAFKIDAELDEIQLVHIHGNYLSYDCCNLTVEIANRTEAKQMTTLLERIGGSRSPIIVGYSGWENDIIMTYLQQRLNEPNLPYNLYWFCYSEDSYNNLPNWLKRHNNVVFVVPETKTIDDSNYEDNLRMDIVQKNNLSAEAVFETLIQKIHLSEPEITKNPLNFLVNLIKGTEKDEENVTSDVFFLNHVVQRLEKLQILEEQYNSNKIDYSKVQTLRSLIISSQYESSLNLLENLQIDIEELEGYQKKELLDILLRLTLRAKPCKELIFASDLLLSVYDSIEEENIDEKLKIEIGISLLKKAETYGTLEEYTEEIKTLNIVREKFKNEKSQAFKVLISESLLQSGVSYDTLKDSSSSLECFDALIYEYGEENDINLISNVANAYMHKIANLGRQRLFEKGIEIADQFIAKYKHIENEDLDLYFSVIYQLKIMLGIDKKENDEILQVSYHEFINRFSYSDNKNIQIRILKGTSDLARYYYLKGKVDSAIPLLDKVIYDFNSLLPNEQVEELIGDACAMCGLAFYDNGKVHEAFEMFKLGHENNNPQSTVNLGYMLRRNEATLDIDIAELFEIGIEHSISIAFVNKALNIVSGKWDINQWKLADKVIKELSTFETEEIQDILDWWYELAKDGDREGHLVIGWLLRHDLIKDPDNLSLKVRLDKAAENATWYVQQFLYEKETVSH